MDWERIESNWQHLKGMVKQRWGKLTDEHLDEIAGKRDKLVGKVEHCYDVTRADAERQVEAWHAKNHDVFAETAAEVKKHVGIARQ